MIILLALVLCVQLVIIFVPTEKTDGSSAQSHAVHEIAVENFVPQANASFEPEEKIIFIMGESDGKIAIFSPDKKEIHEVLNVFVGTLPDGARELLAAGIEITNTEKLYALIEDYTS